MRSGELHLNEIMTNLIHFHQSHYREFKAYYSEHVQVNMRQKFPKLVSDNRFVELMLRTVVPLALYIQRCMGHCTDLSFIDSTALAVSHNHRIHSHRVFIGLAQRGKTMLGWFYRFKLHVVVNACGALLAFCLTAVWQTVR